MSSLPAITGTEAVAETRWLQLKTLTYLDGKGSERKWDFVQRPNGGARIDAVCVATRLLGGVYTEPHIIVGTADLLGSIPLPCPERHPRAGRPLDAHLLISLSPAW